MIQPLNGLDKVCRLKKAIYGLKPAGRQCHKLLDRSLQSFRLKSTSADSYVYSMNLKVYIILVNQN